MPACRKAGLLVACVVAVALWRGSSAAESPLEENLFDLSIEELSSVQITSASRKPEELWKTASAVYVLTAEDIRRSGATNIPDLLRLVPGMNVAGADAKRWAISARGFNNIFAMKLLVLIDGRTVYSPLFSGVEWDMQHVELENIERIEVVRGPGASVWGANAVNGVINIITKSSKDTQDAYVYGGAGNEEKLMTGFRYGGRSGEATTYRVSGQYIDRDSAERADGQNPYNDWWAAHSALRLDSEISEKDLLTMQGDVFYLREQQGKQDNPVVDLFSDFPPYLSRDSGGNALVRWTRSFSDASETQLQVYFMHDAQDDRTVKEAINVFDLDFQRRFPLLSWNDIVWGLGYRSYRDSVVGAFVFDLEPRARSTDLFSSFVQDEICLIKDYLRLIAGTKLEHNVFTGYELQPSVRLALTPTEQQTGWAAVSRAVRTPSRLEHDGITYFGGAADTPLNKPGVALGMGNPEADAEVVYAYELGYRNELTKSFSLDLAAFYNVYEDQLSIELGAPEPRSEPIDHVLLPLVVDNQLAFRSNGLEASLTWQASDWWRLIGSYAYLNIEYDSSSTTNLDVLKGFKREAPEHQIVLRSLYSLSENVELDGALRFVDKVAINKYDNLVESDPVLIADYLELDLRAAWRLSHRVEVALVGKNLIQGKHAEWVQGTFDQPFMLIERSIYAKVLYRF